MSPLAAATKIAASLAAKGASLRAAAAADRIGEIAVLLAEGTPVDTPDEDGETALMKAIKTDHPAAAALLHRHGASLESKNREGDSAREIAASIGDPELNRALGLVP
jgi:ankyrin repeat protein